MAKNKSILKFEGTLDGMTFYKSSDGHLVRTKGGVSKSRIMNDPAYVRTRENMNEFSNVARTGKLLRNSLGSLLRRGKDPRTSSRLMGLLSKIKNLDASSVRGLRVVSQGIGSTEGKTLLQGFDFNKRAPLSQILQTPFDLDTATGILEITDFIPLEHIQMPDGATHVSLTNGVMNFDFETGIYDLQLSPVSNILLDMTSSTITLTPDAMSAGTGNTLHLLLVEFFQEVNGAQYSLRNGAFNVLHLLAVL